MRTATDALVAAGKGNNVGVIRMEIHALRGVIACALGLTVVIPHMPHQMADLHAH